MIIGVGVDKTYAFIYRKEYGAAHNLKPRVAMVVDNIETIKFMVLKGMGISFLPELCFKNELASGELFSVPIDPPLNIKRELEIIYLKKNKVPFLSFFV